MKGANALRRDVFEGRVVHKVNNGHRMELTLVRLWLAFGWCGWRKQWSGGRSAWVCAGEGKGLV